MKQVMLILTINKEVGMKSMTEVKKGIGWGLAAVVIAAALSAVPAKAAVLAGGTVPLENYFVAQGVEGLDIAGGSGGAAAVIGHIWIWNNSPGSFTLTVTGRNGGFLQQGLAAILPAAGTAVSQGNPFSAVCTLDDGATATADQVWGPTAAVAASSNFSAVAPAHNVVYTPGVQLVATVDYPFDIMGTWVADATMLAGYYSETFTISLVAVL